MAPDRNQTDTLSIPVGKLFGKILPSLLGLAIVGLFTSHISSRESMTEMRGEIRSLRENQTRLSEIQESIKQLTVDTKAGPEWMRDKLRNHDVRIRDLEKK